jgi:hypothetical protein
MKDGYHFAWMKDGIRFAWMKEDGFPSTGTVLLDKPLTPSPFVRGDKNQCCGVAEPASGALIQGGGGGGGKIQIWDPDPGSRINILDHISKSLVTIFWVTNTLALCCGSGSGIRWLFDTGSWLEKFGSGIRNTG